MTAEAARRLSLLTSQLIETLMTAVLCADEIRGTIDKQCDGAKDTVRNDEGEIVAASIPRPLVDISTLSVCWAGKSCRLGSTLLFRLAEKLARRPNQFLSAEQLRHDVWKGDRRSAATVRSAVRHLRERLSQAGMAELANAIQGSDGRYGMILHKRR